MYPAIGFFKLFFNLTDLHLIGLEVTLCLPQRPGTWNVHRVLNARLI